MEEAEEEEITTDLPKILISTSKKGTDENVKHRHGSPFMKAYRQQLPNIRKYLENVKLQRELQAEKAGLITRFTSGIRFSRPTRHLPGEFAVPMGIHAFSPSANPQTMEKFDHRQEAWNYVLNNYHDPTAKARMKELEKDVCPAMQPHIRSRAPSVRTTKSQLTPYEKPSMLVGIEIRASAKASMAQEDQNMEHSPASRFTSESQFQKSAQALKIPTTQLRSTLGQNLSFASLPSSDDSAISLTENEIPMFSKPPRPYRPMRFRLVDEFRDIDNCQQTFGWVNERLNQSSRSCRFELPMDMKEFETLNVHTYLLKYCKIASHRQRAYKKVFEKFKSKVTGVLDYKDTIEALHGVLGKTVHPKDIRPFLVFASITPKTQLSLPLFQASCALAERILYSTFLGRHQSLGEVRGLLECADFCGLEWKLRGVNIDSGLKKLLISLG